jgi:hypothetical protein
MSICIACRELPPGAKGRLERDRYTVFQMPPFSGLDPRIASHPDIQLFIMRDKAFCHPGMDAEFERELSRYISVYRCSRPISRTYPDDCIYNIAFTGKYALYKKENIPVEIEKAFSSEGIISVHIPQGYARCSIIPVDEYTIATEDAAIANNAEKKGIKVIPLPAGLIPLKGFPRGFAGGAFGLLKKNLYCIGMLPDHPAYSALRQEIASRDMTLTELSEKPAEDFGSLLFIEG